jgi:hypothetical protein
MNYCIAVWRMVKEAVTATGDVVISMSDIKKYIFDHFGDVHAGTISDQTMACCVNRQSRVGMPENHKPRIANGNYDFLFYLSRDHYTLYDPGEHGQWEIADCDGKLVVRRTDKSETAFISKSSDILQPVRANRRTVVRSDIESPSGEAVKHYISQWNTLEAYKAQEFALNKLFCEFCPKNNNLDEVLLKVAALNAFYSTNIYNVFSVAQHIVSLGIDEQLKRGDESLVSSIATGHGVKHSKNGKEIKFYSFATKYCSHHRPEIYPIYDSFVEELLVYLRNVDEFAAFRREDLYDYSSFRRIILALQSFYSLESYSMKEIDQYLWQYGKEKFPKKY